MNVGIPSPVRAALTLTKVVLLVGSVLTAATAWATTYYVSTAGSDANPGTDSQPFRTIKYAYGRANPGDTVVVKPGVYTEYPGLYLNRNGSSSSPIVLKSQFKWQAVLDGKNTAGHDQGIFFQGSYNIVDGFEILNSYKGGIAVYGSYNRILNNNIHHNGNTPSSSGYGQDGIYSDKYSRGNMYIGNYIHHNGRISQDSNLDHGMYLTGDDELAANNIVTYNSAYGLHIAGYDTVSNMRIYNNLSAWNGRSGVLLWLSMSGVDIKNNIFYKNRLAGIDTYDAHGTGVVIDRNMFFGNPSGTFRMNYGGSNVSYSLGTNFTTDPLFVNETSDFHLRSGSPAIDTGAALSQVTTDFDGAPRQQGCCYDIGAHEFSQNGSQLPQPLNLTVNP